MEMEAVGRCRTDVDVACNRSWISSGQCVLGETKVVPGIPCHCWVLDWKGCANKQLRPLYSKFHLY